MLGALLMLLPFFFSCNVTKHLPPGETLYAGAKVNVKGAEKKQRKELSSELKSLVRPKPNTIALGMRYKLWLYYLGGGDSSKGIGGFIRKKFGEPPVLTSSVPFEKNRQILENHMENKGYFHATVTADTVTKKKLTTLVFDAYAGPQYKIRNLSFPEDSSKVSRSIAETTDESLLAPGDPYDLDVIKNERVRIDKELKNRGYYYFTPDYIIARVDSTVGEHQVDIYLRVKPNAAVSDLQPYRIDNIWVYPTYTLESDSMLAEAPAITYDDYHVIDPQHLLKPKTFGRMLVFDKGDVYSRDRHNTSLNRLMSMGTFKFVKARFEEVDTQGYYLDPYFFLTPLPRRSLRAELTGLTKSNNATGSELTLSWTDRNTFRGAEQLTISGFGGLETQVYGGQSNSITRFGGEVNLLLPRVLAPFRLNTTSDFVPKTRINLRYEYYARTKQYVLNSYNGSYGFVWKSNLKNEFQLNIVNLNYVQPQRIDPDFQQALDTDIVLARTIEPQFILGPSFNYNYNSNNEPNFNRSNYYFNFNFEAPGNVLGVATGTEFDKDKRGLGKFLNTVFAQYVRTEVDGRYYYRYGDKKHLNDVVAARLLLGFGYPYGNSFEMPFIKSFFAGGVNDLRAFRARTVGPGSYHAVARYANQIIPDQPGDIKLLSSLELRKKLISIVNGAAFIDAGNIWTVRADSSRPGAQFGANWMNQIAVGAGLGLRLDLSFLIVRVDLATPIRLPYGEGTPSFDFGNREYRKENLILNLALGYPF